MRYDVATRKNVVFAETPRPFESLTNEVRVLPLTRLTLLRVLKNDKFSWNGVS